jgi:dolichol-phosphate mannosyltransferase
MSAAANRHTRLLAFVQWLKGVRYIKFGLVGAGGTVVNLVVLSLAHAYLFTTLEAPGSKPYYSLALAIAIATVNNFTWNRLWTWADRVQADQQAQVSPGIAVQLAQYAAASWFGIALQYGLTLWLADVVHHLGPSFALPDAQRLILANVVAIVIASVANFLANDWWTFRRHGAG